MRKLRARSSIANEVESQAAQLIRTDALPPHTHTHTGTRVLFKDTWLHIWKPRVLGTCSVKRPVV